MFKKRLSSADPEYRSGALSAFPHAKDNPLTLYIARNNAETQLIHSCTGGSKYIIVKDAKNFPDIGILKINLADESGDPELIHYFRKIGNQFHLLQRGFAATRMANWPAGSKVSCPLVAEHHNVLKDAVMNIQRKIGTMQNASADTLHTVLNNLENKWLAPKASFRAWPKKGPAPLNVRFQNVSGGLGIKFFWDFGDGSSSTDENPNHTYEREGNYTVKLNIVSSTNSQGIAEKSNYITVDDNHHSPFFYVVPNQGFSVETAKSQGMVPTVFTFVDQTDGDIVERDWFFGDGISSNQPDPNIHTADYVFDKPGDYAPSLMIRYKDKILNATLSEKLMVI